jgi:phosphohistidine phosphatase
VAKRLHLLRHAKSSWDEPGLADRERPLAPRGRKAAKRMARYLEDAGVRPDLVLCSSSVRTRQTLERVVQGLPDGTPVELEDGLYAASASALIERLRQVPAATETVLVIAHNPGLQDLARLLAGPGSAVARLDEKFPTGALATLVHDGAWTELRAGACELVELVFPRELP